jgi:hypothetical protein
VIITSITSCLLALALRANDPNALPRIIGIIGGALVFVLIIRLIMKKIARKRMLAMQSVAKQLGWTFFAEAPLTYIQGVENFPLFNQGHSKKILNLMTGEANGIKVSVFDYEYKTGGGKNVSVHHQSVVYLEPTNLNLPYFSLGPEGLLTKIGAAFGYDDIDFGQRPEFSRRFVLRGQDEPGIRRVFNDRLLAFYEGRIGMSTEAGGNQVFLYRTRNQFQPFEIQPNVGLGLELVNLFHP